MVKEIPARLIYEAYMRVASIELLKDAKGKEDYFFRRAHEELKKAEQSEAEGLANNSPVDTRLMVPADTYLLIADMELDAGRPDASIACYQAAVEEYGSSARNERELRYRQDYLANCLNEKIRILGDSESNARLVSYLRVVLEFLWYIKDEIQFKENEKPQDEDFLSDKSLSENIAVLLDGTSDIERKGRIIAALYNADDTMLATIERAMGQAKAPAEPETWVQTVGRAAPQPAANVPPPPTKAPALYAERPIDPKTGRQEGVDKFLPRAYKPWIVDGVLMLPRKLIEQLDPACDAALTAWPGNHKGQEFPVQIARKNAIPTVSEDEVREARRMANRADYLRRREARNSDARAKHP